MSEHRFWLLVDEYMGQIAQRLNMVEEVDVDNFGE